MVPFLRNVQTRSLGQEGDGGACPSGTPLVPSPPYVSSSKNPNWCGKFLLLIRTKKLSYDSVMASMGVLERFPSPLWALISSSWGSPEMQMIQRMCQRSGSTEEGPFPQVGADRPGSSVQRRSSEDSAATPKTASTITLGKRFHLSLDLDSRRLRNPFLCSLHQTVQHLWLGLEQS